MICLTFFFPDFRFPCPGSKSPASACLLYNSACFPDWFPSSAHPWQKYSVKTRPASRRAPLHRKAPQTLRSTAYNPKKFSNEAPVPFPAENCRQILPPPLSALLPENSESVPDWSYSYRPLQTRLFCFRQRVHRPAFRIKYASTVQKNDS